MDDSGFSGAPSSARLSRHHAYLADDSSRTKRETVALTVHLTYIFLCMEYRHMTYIGVILHAYTRLQGQWVTVAIDDRCSE